MSQVSMGYDNPTYVTRQSVMMGANTAGTTTTPVNKFVAWTAMVLYSVTATNLTAGTSTTTLWNGTGTATNINGDSFTVRRYTNIGGGALTTATFGTFAVAPYNGTATATQTSTAGINVRIQLTGTATTGVAQAGTNTADGGVVLQQGDIIDILRGADATAVTAFAFEIGILPLANITHQ